MNNGIIPIGVTLLRTMCDKVMQALLGSLNAKYADQAV